MFSFQKLRSGLYQLKFDDRYEMCMSFLRYQENYESPRYHGKKFTLAEFMSWYAHNKDSDCFTYPADWGGFNIPASVIGRVHEMGIDDPNHYDSLMLSLYKTMVAECNDAYLIGVDKEGSATPHEITHGMFHIVQEYREGCLKILAGVKHQDLIASLAKVLLDVGYAHVTALDEIQAYCTTGDDIFKEFRKDARYRALKKQLKELHNEFYPDFIDEISL